MMLSLSVALRQQGQCLRAAMAAQRAAHAAPFTSLPALAPAASVASAKTINAPSPFRSSLVPARHFSVSGSRLGGAGSDHVGMWTAERVVSALCIPGMLVPLAFTNPVTDAIFCTLLVVHSHWGEKE